MRAKVWTSSCVSRPLDRNANDPKNCNQSYRSGTQARVRVSIHISTVRYPSNHRINRGHSGSVRRNAVESRTGCMFRVQREATTKKHARGSAKQGRRIFFLIKIIFCKHILANLISIFFSPTMVRWLIA